MFILDYGHIYLVHFNVRETIYVVASSSYDIQYSTGDVHEKRNIIDYIILRSHTSEMVKRYFLQLLIQELNELL